MLKVRFSNCKCSNFKVTSLVVSTQLKYLSKGTIIKRRMEKMERGGKGKKYLKRETSSVLGMGSFLKNEVDRICGLVQKEGILSSSPL